MTTGSTAFAESLIAQVIDCVYLMLDEVGFAFAGAQISKEETAWKYIDYIGDNFDFMFDTGCRSFLKGRLLKQDELRLILIDGLHELMCENNHWGVDFDVVMLAICNLALRLRDYDIAMFILGESKQP